MKRALRWTRRIALGVFAFAVLAVAIVLGALHTSWGRNRVRVVVEKQLQSAFPGSTIGSIEGSVLGDLIARDITIVGRDKRPLATVKKLTLEAALLPLVGKTARVQSITAEDVVVYAHDQGPAPAPKPEPTPAAPSEPSTWSVELPAIRVARGKVVIETATSTEVIDQLDARVSLSLRAGEPLIASVNAQAMFRGEGLHVRAVATQGDVLAVPYAIVSLGAARVVAAGATIDGTKIAASLSAHVPAALVAKLAEVELPGDAAVIAGMSQTGQLELSASVGGANAHVLAKTDLEQQRAHAIVTADVADLAAISNGAVTGSGIVVATVVADPQRVDGIVTVVGDAEGNGASALIALNATLDRARVLVAAASDQPPRRQTRQDQKESFPAWRLRRFGGSMLIERTADAWSLRESRFDAAAASELGEVAMTLTASGPLSPQPSLAVQGTVDGKDIRYDDLSVASVQTRFAATDLPARPTGTVDVDVRGVQRGTLAIPLAMLGVRGTMHEDGTIDADLTRHRVRTADGLEWAGASGHVRVTEQSIAITKLATGSGTSRITAQALIGRTSDAVMAKVTARDVAIAMLDPTLSGTLAADLDVSRMGGMWKGTATIDANQIVVPHRPVLDGKVEVTLDKRRVTARTTVSNPAIGSATLDLDVIGPRDITDALAWQRLERSAIQRVRIALSKIDASKLGASGSLDGELAISAIDAGGKVDVKGIVTEVGTIDSQLALAPGPRGEIAAHGTLHLGGVDPVDVNAILSLPIHPFDPDGWAQLGRETLRGATIEAKRIAFDPDLMKRFGIDSPWRGWAAVKVQIGPAARSSELAIDVHELRDGLLTKPVDIHISGTSDAAGPRLDATVRTDTLSFALAAKSPLSLESMLAGNTPSVPIEASVTVPPSAAREIAMLIGRNDVLAGTVAGSIHVGGTIAAPTARAQLTVDNLSVSAGIASKPPTLEKLEVDGRWLGMKAGFELELTGHETGGRLLKISARGQPEELDSIVASIEAASFDITPFLAFAPEGPAVGMRGLISGVLKLRGLDPQTGDVRGRLVVSDLRVPLTAELGTLRSGQLEINVIKKEVHATLDGKIGRGTIKAKSVMRLTGSMPTAAELTVALRKVSPIGAVQPQIDADISGWFARTRSKWAGKITVANGNIYVPPDGGNELLGTGAPGDIVFIDKQQILLKPKRKRAAAPWLLADIDIRPTKLLVEDTDFNFTGVASGQLKLQVGDGISLDGALSTETGNVEVLGRRYRLDHGVVDFDGSLDPRLDIRLMRDFSSMTLTVDILGRSSNPDLRLSSDSGSYSQGQLLSFLAGATPSDDPSAQSGDALASGGLTMLSSRVGKKLNEYVPLIKFDTINYEAKTASSSRAIRVGKRLGEHTYLNFRNRFEPRPDENAREAVIEHELRRNVLIEATGGDRGAGADLLWRRRW